MKLTTYTDFGIRTLMYLATLPEGTRSSSADVANVYQASRNHIAKVIAHLSALGYIQSSRGKNGGIWLIQPAEEINIGKLIRQLENNLSGIDCQTTNCRLTSACKLKVALQAGTDAFLATMDQFYLSHLIENKNELNEILHFKEYSISV